MNNVILTYNIKTLKWQYLNKSYDSFIEGLKDLALTNKVVAWCYSAKDQKELNLYLDENNFGDIPELITFGSHLFLENTEYLEFSNVYFNKFSKNDTNTFDTWRVRSNIGIISASVVNELAVYSFPKNYKSALAVLGYASFFIGAIVSVSNHKRFSNFFIEGLTNKEYIDFVCYSKKKKWVFYYILSTLIFEKKIVLPGKTIFKNSYQDFQPQKVLWKDLYQQDIDMNTIKVDAFIPTLGRPNFVMETLQSIADNNYPIDKFFIVEQKLPGQEKTLLDAVLSKDWGFKIEHVLLEKVGLCNARNVGLSSSNADYIIMLDDDILINNQPNLIKNLIKKLEFTKSKMISFATDNIKGEIPVQLSYMLAGGASLIKNKDILPFNIQIEGLGSDDQEYNFNAHHNFQRIICTNEEYMNHLKAPMGGWRFDAKEYLPWYKDNLIVPLPGPATLYRYIKYASKNQLKGYKVFVFFKYYKFKIWKLLLFSEKWNKSLYWANEILKDKVKINIEEGIKSI